MQGGGPVAVLLSPRWSGFKLGRSKRYSEGGGPKLFFRFLGSGTDRPFPLFFCFGGSHSSALPQACRIKCRHILATEEHVPQLKSYESISEIYSSLHFKTAFENYELSLPTPQEIQAAGTGPFPPIVQAPQIKRGRGRPRIKRLRKWYEGLRRKAAIKDGIDPMEKRRCCKLCRRIGHDRRTCPERQRFANGETMAKS